MVVKKITCFGIDEKNDFTNKIHFLKIFQNVELSIQISLERVSYQIDIRFDLLFDYLFKEGIVLQERKTLPFDGVFQGYGSDLDSFNIHKKLNKINRILSENVATQEKLAENALFSFEKATSFVQNIYSWNQKNV